MRTVDLRREMTAAQAAAVLELPKLPRDEIALRSTWWRLRRHHGVNLPAERGVIVIDGDAALDVLGDHAFPAIPLNETKQW